MYIASFPKEERLPWWVMRLLGYFDGAELVGYTDGDRLVGFAYAVGYRDIYYVMFLCVDKDMQGRGYGSQILGLMRRENPKRKILLNVELLDQNASNYEDRVRRVKFYEKNGFFDTGYNIDEVGGTFRIMATSPEIDAEAYVSVFRHISFGMWRPPVVKAENR